jgi:hypothetical protein
MIGAHSLQFENKGQLDASPGCRWRKLIPDVQVFQKTLYNGIPNVMCGEYYESVYT